MSLGEPSPQQKAADAIFNQIASEAGSADPKELDVLATAYHRVRWGAQGGHMVNETDYDYRSKTDQHETKHEGDNRKAPAGFTPREGES